MNPKLWQIQTYFAEVLMTFNSDYTILPNTPFDFCTFAAPIYACKSAKDDYNEMACSLVKFWGFGYVANK